MTEAERQQAIALAHPCLLGGETVHPRYGWRGFGYTAVITINTGYE